MLPNFKDLKDKSLKLAEDLKKRGEEKILLASLSLPHIAEIITSSDWYKEFNTFKSEVSQAMDSGYLSSKLSEAMNPSNHRIFDGGHDFFSSIERAMEVGQENGWDSLKTFTEWGKAYFSDMSSPAGMPMFGQYSDEIYKFLVEMGISKSAAADFVSLNGQEVIEALLGGTIAGAALIFAWKREDKEAFSIALGSIVAGAAHLSPLVLIIGVLGLAFGYNKMVCKEAMARGFLTSGAGLLISAVIPGPALLGILPALIATLYLRKHMGEDFKPVEFSQKLITLVQSPEFKERCRELFNYLKDNAIVDKKSTTSHPSQAAS